MGKYEEIINMPHHVSEKHPKMAKNERSAQFAPYAALSGYDAVVRETARRTSRRIALDEYEICELNKKMLEMADNIDTKEYAITYFIPDRRKQGGKYVTELCRIKRIDPLESVIVTVAGENIPMAEIIEIEEIKDEP